MKNNKKGFTLAEVLIALTVLGIIASLTIPTIIQKQREAANRTKIKKSMTVYDRMFAKMIIENNLKSEQAVRDFVKTDCSNTASYLKIAESLSTENSCKIKTSDGVSWNIEDIFHPVISLKEDDLDDLTSKNTFQMVTSFDPKTGAFRTNDLQYEIANNGSEDEMRKLFAYVKPEIGGGNGGGEAVEESERTFYPSPCKNPDNAYSCTNCKACSVYESGIIYEYDKQGNMVAQYISCADANTRSGCYGMKDFKTGEHYRGCSDGANKIGCNELYDADNNFYAGCSDFVNKVGCQYCADAKENSIECP